MYKDTRVKLPSPQKILTIEKPTQKEFKLFIPRGFALSIWEILLETASQFGYEIKDS